MEKFNTLATKVTLASGVVLAGGMALAQIFDDGIAGCIEKDGRLHFQMDNGEISAQPIQPLQFGNDDNCIISHGGSEAPSVYEQVDVAGSDFPQKLANEAAGFSNEEWEAIQPTQEVGAFETFVAHPSQTGEGFTLLDESGDAAENVLATAFSEETMPVSQGSSDDPVSEGEEIAPGSVIVAYESNKSDEGIRVARVPYDNTPIMQLK